MAASCRRVLAFIDEIGYLSLRGNTAIFLFQVSYERYLMSEDERFRAMAELI